MKIYVKMKTKIFLNFRIIFGEIILFQTSSKIHVTVQCTSDIVPSVIQGQCWNRHDINRGNKRGQQLRSRGHLSNGQLAWMEPNLMTVKI
jgi:hypothetical protein